MSADSTQLTYGTGVYHFILDGSCHLAVKALAILVKGVLGEEKNLSSYGIAPNIIQLSHVLLGQFALLGKNSLIILVNKLDGAGVVEFNSQTTFSTKIEKL